MYKYMLKPKEQAERMELVHAEAAGRLKSPKLKRRLEQLDRKENRLLWSSPKMKRVRAQTRERIRRLEILGRRVDKLLERMRNERKRVQR